MLGLQLPSSTLAIPKFIPNISINPKRHRPIKLQPKSRFTTLNATNNNDDPIITTASDDKTDDRQPLFDFKWSDLLNPDADNVLAVGLTGLLTWASVQVLWQLVFISFAILVAAVKYSFIAAILLFILITLL